LVLKLSEGAEKGELAEIKPEIGVDFLGLS
jgi:hypothetical protein